MELTVNQALLDGDDAGAPAALPEGVFAAGADLPPDRVKLFEVNERQYTGPRRVDKRIAFRYLREVHHGGGAEGMATLLYEVLGTAVMNFLADEELDDDQFDQVMKVVEKHVMGATERSLGNSRTARRR